MSGYSRVPDHRAMVFDAVRNAAYARAIRQSVTPRSTVLDLGAGLGLHGLIAARAGARTVYLLEPEATLEVAVEIAAANGLGSRIIPVGSTLEDAALPERVDLIVSVFTGNFLLGEDLLPVLFEARDRYLAPGGKLLPDRAIMEIVPVCAPAIHAREVAAWSGRVQELAFDRARVYAANSIYARRETDPVFEFLASPSEILDLDLATATDAACRGRVAFDLTKDGLCHGFLGWFRMRLGDAWLSTSPQASPTHWSQSFLPLDPPVELEAGASASLALTRPEYGDWTWTFESGAVRQRHSTFLSVPHSPRLMKTQADSYCPALNRRGSACRFVMARMDGKLTVLEIARELVDHFPDLYPRLEGAGRFVREVALRYG